jgi:hypothetical protein
MNSKKASFFSVLLVVMTLAVLVTAIGVISSAGKDKNAKVGENEIALFNSVKEGQKHLLYVDLSADTAFKKALYDFELNGHYPKCGSAEDFNLWTIDNKNCWPNPESDAKSLGKVFADNLNNYLSSYGKVQMPKISQADIIVNFSQKKIFGRPFWSIQVSASPVNYAVQPNFVVDTDYDFDYVKITSALTAIENTCSQLQDLNIFDNFALRDCINLAVEQLNKEQTELVYSLDCSSAEFDKQNPYAEAKRRCESSLDSACKCELSLVKGSGFGVLEQPRQLTSLEQSYPLCRIDDRIAKICVQHKKTVLINNEIKPVITKLAYKIKDDALPVVEYSVEGNVVKFNSPCADIKEYIVYFGVQGEKSDTVPRAQNYAEQTYTLPAGENQVSVIAVDYSGLRSG